MPHPTWKVLIAAFGLLSSIGCSGESFTGGDGGIGDAYYPPGWENPNINPNRPSCPGREATLTGTVLAPNGADPVPGASVFIPSQVPEIFPPMVQCEVCGSLGGSANWWITTSEYNGKFTLTGVCPGKRPVVFQNGRFRRLVWVDIPDSGTVQLTAAQTRLPRRNAEFELADSIPKIAVATGDYDKMECVLRKIGLEDKAIELYEDAEVLASPSKLPTFASLVNDLNKLKTYNIVFINCTANTFETELQKPAVRQNISDYMQSGGRFYVTDWSYDWIEQVEAFSPFIDFEGGSPWGAPPEKPNAAALGANGLKVNATLKAPELAQWLGQFPGAVQNGTALIQYFLSGWVVMHAIGKDVKLWVEGPISGQGVTGVRPLTVTFNFKNCGKILYTSYHTEGRDDEIFPTAFPQYCGGQATPSPQDRILEYLIFDIANCIKPIE
jgi:hypothetical protein